jgi:sugar O-acyltransferase (sialic acid O-acetyltransferase NeuD family)
VHDGRRAARPHRRRKGRSLSKRLVIAGAGEFAEIAYEYFTHDSPWEVAAFSVDEKYIETPELLGLPVVPFERLAESHPPSDFAVYTAATYTQLNRVRARFYRICKERGYEFASYVSSRAFVWRNATIGENTFIFENNVVQYHAAIGNDVVLWSGNHIGHRAVVRDHCFLSSHVVVSGYCDIGESSFIGVGAAIGDRVKIGRDSVIGAGAVIVKDTEEGRIYRGNPAQPASVGALRAFRVSEENE